MSRLTVWRRARTMILDRAALALAAGPTTSGGPKINSEGGGALVHRPDEPREDAHYPEALVRALMRDLLGIYERAGREVRYEDQAGKERAYWPRRYHQALKRAIKTGHTVEFADLLVCSSKPSRGFFILKDAGRLDLTVEALAADETKVYHTELFTDEAVEASRTRLAEHGLAQNAAPHATSPEAMPVLAPGSSLYLRVAVGDGGELTVTLV